MSLTEELICEKSEKFLFSMARSCSSKSSALCSFVSCLLISAAFLSRYVECTALPIVDLDGKQPNSTVSSSPNTLNFQCSYERTWTNIPHWDIDECYATIMYMVHEEGLDPAGRDIEYREFVSTFAHPQPGPRRPILTPRKYVVGKLSSQYVPMRGHRSFPAELFGAESLY